MALLGLAVFAVVRDPVPLAFAGAPLPDFAGAEPRPVPVFPAPAACFLRAFLAGARFERDLLDPGSDRLALPFVPVRELAVGADRVPAVFALAVFGAAVRAADVFIAVDPRAVAFRPPEVFPAGTDLRPDCAPDLLFALASPFGAAPERGPFLAA